MEKKTLNTGVFQTCMKQYFEINKFKEHYIYYKMCQMLTA